MSDSKLTQFYNHVESAGKLRTPMHAKRYSRAVLQTFGLNLPRALKKELANAIPEQLGKDLYGVFWLAHFRDTNYSAAEFQERVARRSGNTDKAFARYPILAVFGGLQTLIDKNLSDKIADNISPDLKELWQSASQMGAAGSGFG